MKSLSHRQVLGFLLIILPFAAAARPGGQVCERRNLESPPQFPNGALWTHGGKSLLVTDVAARKILRYSPKGELLGAVEDTGMAPYTISQPTEVHLTADGYLVRNSTAYWVWFDSSFKPKKVVGPGGPDTITLFDEVFTGSELVGLGAMRVHGQKEWMPGLIRARPHPLELIEVVEKVSYGPGHGDFHRMQVSAVAKAGGTVYVLRYGEPSFIQRAHPKGRLQAFPKGFESLPSLPPIEGEASVRAIERVISESAVPVALYGSGRYLFLLTRQPAGKETTWKLHKIDPEKDRLLGSVTLPTTAFELVLAPGPEKWAILEKGPSDGAGNQKVTDLLLVSTRWIEEDGLKAGASVSCN